MKLHGSVPDARTYLHAFDIFFFPSKKEGLPYALLEAGHAELPVIASDIGGIPDIIESEKYGLLIDPFDISSAARALEIYVSEPERRSETARALKARVQERFTTTRMVASTFACYER